jgi:hypothetical protein
MEFALRQILIAFALSGSAVCSAPVMAQDDLMAILASMESGDRYVAPRRSAIRDNFVFPTNVPVRIVLFRPDVKVTEQTTAGLEQPKADWTEAARAQIANSMQAEQSRRGAEMRMMPVVTGDDERLMVDYKKLFKFVADSAIRHQLFAEKPLPTKADKFDWSLGSGIAKLGALGGGDYGLFLYTFDSYESLGHKNAQRIGKLMGGSADVQEPETRIGYAGLVDLKSGELVWLNVDVNSKGDVRTAVGADIRVANLLRGFPAPVVVAITAKAKGRGKGK